MAPLDGSQSPKKSKQHSRGKASLASRFEGLLTNCNAAAPSPASPPTPAPPEAPIATATAAVDAAAAGEAASRVQAAVVACTAAPPPSPPAESPGGATAARLTSAAAPTTVAALGGAGGGAGTQMVTTGARWEVLAWLREAFHHVDGRARRAAAAASGEAAPGGAIVFQLYAVLSSGEEVPITAAEAHGLSLAAREGEAAWACVGCRARGWSQARALVCIKCYAAAPMAAAELEELKFAHRKDGCATCSRTAMSMQAHAEHACKALPQARMLSAGRRAWGAPLVAH